MSTRPDKRALLRRLYGFDFPDDLFSFWEFAKRVRPLEPTLALAEVTNTYLVGPFDVLAGRVDARAPSLPMALHWRYYDDPPEFFTVMRRGEGGLHWGYFLDDPGAAPGCIASYETDATFEINPDADDLFETVRLDLERHYRDCAELRQEDPLRAYEYQVQMDKLDEVRHQLMRFGTAERSETGEAYEEKYPERTSRSTRIVARTRDGMGIVAPADAYRPLALANKQLWQRLRREDEPTDLVVEAFQALRDGYPATALKLGKDLWAFGGERRRDHAYRLLDAAYAGLGRPVLQEVLRAHHRNRDLPTVDILEGSPPLGEG